MQTKLFTSIVAIFFVFNSMSQNKWTSYTNKDRVYCMAFEENKIWVGTMVGILCRDISGPIIAEYNSPEGLTDNMINSICIDNIGNKWFATSWDVKKFDGESWTTYGYNSGLESYGAYKIEKDAEGNLWFATGWGVRKFDGENWTKFNTSNSGLVSNFVNCISVDSKGNKWFGTDNGISRFDGINWTNYLKNYGGNSISIWDIAFDKNGNKWVAGMQTGTMPDKNAIFIYNDTTWTFFDNKNSGYFKNFGNVTIDENGNKWFIGSGSGIYKFDGNIWTNYNSINSGLINSWLTALAFDSKGDMWVGSLNGLCKFDGATWKTYNTSNFGVPYDILYSIETDAKDNKWIGTYSNGVYEYNGVSWTAYNPGNSGLSSKWVKNIAIDQQNNKWFVTDLGINMFDGKNWITYNTANSGIISNNIKALAIDIEGNKWLSTDQGICKFDGTTWSRIDFTFMGSSHYSVDANNIYIDAQGNKWFVANNGVFKFDGTTWTNYNTSNSGLSDNRVISMAIDPQGNKWFATVGAKLSKFDDITWTSYNTDRSKIINSIRSLIIDSAGNKWISTNSEGVFKFDGLNWTNYHVHNSGLIDDDVYSIRLDSLGAKWIATYHGLCKLEDGGAGPIKWDNYKPVYGSVFNDLNGNGVKDDGEPLLLHKYVKILNDSSFATTKDNGIFCIIRKKGKYQIKYIPEQNWVITSDSIKIIEINDTTMQIRGIEFGTKINDTINDVSIDFTGEWSRAGFNVNYKLTYKNEGGLSKSGDITLDIDTLVAFVNSTPVPDLISNHRLTWYYSNLHPFETKQINLSLKMPDIKYLGDTVITTATINPIFNDITPANNTSVLKQIITGSYDPNDKIVNTGLGEIGNTFSENDELTYTIRFQNNGTDTAFNVVIRDTIDDKLNMETFRLISSSHDVFAELKDKNVTSFIFKNINLPDDKKNEPASHGFVKYALTPFNNFAIHTELKNKGYIYFDFNPPIVTNEVKSFFVSKSPASLIVSTEEINIQALANSMATFDITSNVFWNVSSAQTWLTVNKSSGSNNATINLTASANITSVPRVAIVTVSGNDVPLRTITVTQEAGGGTMVSNTSDFAELLLYPIPVSNELLIKNKNDNLISSVTIFTLNGKQVFSLRINKHETTLDMSKYKPGIYFAKIILSNNTVIIKKIIKNENNKKAL